MRAIWMASTPYTPAPTPSTPRNTQRLGFKAGVCRRSLPPFCTFPYIRAIKRGDGGSAEVDSNTQIRASLWLEPILRYFERVLLVAGCGGQRHWGCSGWGKERKRRPSKDHSYNDLERQSKNRTKMNRPGAFFRLFFTRNPSMTSYPWNASKK